MAGRRGYVAQIIRADDRLLSVQDQLPTQEDANKYQANIFRKFDVANDKPVAILHGEASGGTVEFTGDGWTGAITGGHFKATKSGESFDLQHITRTPPSLGAKPPAKAIVLFDGTNMNSWAKMKEKDWLTEDGPSLWHLVPVAAMEVVPRTGSLISRKSFGDAKIHVEFRKLGGPTNSGVYIQDRYEANINESLRPPRRQSLRRLRQLHARRTPSPKSAAPARRSSGRRSISISTPRVSMPPAREPPPPASRCSSTAPRSTPISELGPITLNAARLGEAPTGPIQLQEHGMPVQFRNIWVLEQ